MKYIKSALCLNLILTLWSSIFPESSAFSTFSISRHLSTVGSSSDRIHKRRKACTIGTRLLAAHNKENESTTTLPIATNKSSFFPVPDENDCNVVNEKNISSIEDKESEILGSNKGYSDDEKEEMAKTIMTLIFIIGSLSSLDRVAMSVALVPMSAEMGISDTVKGSISSFFSVGYGLAILPAGLVLSKLSPRAIMAAGICLWSAGTIITPFSVATGNMSLLLSARTLVGASESVVIPAVQQLLSNWIAPEKKSFAVAIVYCGFQTGTIMAYSLSPQVIDYFDDWRSVFYLYGGAGLLFLIPWLTLAKDSPDVAFQNRESNEDSKNVVIDSSNGDQPSFANSLQENFDSAKEVFLSAPWKEFKESKGVWAMFMAHAANNWGLYNNLSWTPTFYSEQYGLNVKESALLLVVPSIAGAIGGLSSGKIADSVIQNLETVTDDDITRVRRAFQGLALLGPAVCLSVLASNIPEEPWIAQTLFAAAVGLQSFNAAGYGAANQEKAGAQWTGLLYSITSLPSVMVGTFGVYLTGKILDATNQNWSYVFGLNAFVYMLGGLAFATLYDSRKEFD